MDLRKLRCIGIEQEGRIPFRAGGVPERKRGKNRDQQENGRQADPNSQWNSTAPRTASTRTGLVLGWSSRTPSGVRRRDRRLIFDARLPIAKATDPSSQKSVLGMTPIDYLRPSRYPAPRTANTRTGLVLGWSSRTPERSRRRDRKLIFDARLPIAKATDPSSQKSVLGMTPIDCLRPQPVPGAAHGQHTDGLGIGVVIPNAERSEAERRRLIFDARLPIAKATDPSSRKFGPRDDTYRLPTAPAGTRRRARPTHGRAWYWGGHPERRAE